MADAPPTPQARRWQAHLTGKAARPPVEGLTPRDVAWLWPLLSAPEAWPARRELEDAGLQPAFDAALAARALERLAPGDWLPALRVLHLLVAPPTAALKAACARVLGPPEAWARGAQLDGWVASALARFAGAEPLEALAGRLEAGPLRQAELALAPELGDDTLLALAGSRHAYLEADDAEPARPLLAQEPAYLAFARRTVAAAVERLEALHAGRAPYRADGAFVTDDAHVVARCARVAASVDADWLRPAWATLLPRSAVAPGEGRTAPSQALAVALGHAAVAEPTPEAVDALRVALEVVRHAGLKKKLARNLTAARRALAGRPEVALRLVAQATEADPGLRAQLATCLEAGWWLGQTWRAEDWLGQLATPMNGRPFATELLWTLGASGGGAARAFLLEGGEGPPRPLDARGQPVAWDGEAEVRLWHPVEASETEGRAWREALRARLVRQPLAQVFREVYRLPEGEAAAVAHHGFADHRLEVRTLLGVARREGWRVDREAGLDRGFGALRVALALDPPVYPGQGGQTLSGALVFLRRQGRGWAPLPLGEVGAVPFSEACRAVDLLVSASAVGLGRAAEVAEGEEPAAAARRRREAVARALAGPLAEGRVALGERHLRVGPYAVHLATARVTLEGETVALPGAAGGRRPEGDALVQRLVETAQALLARAEGR